MPGGYSEMYQKCVEEGVKFAFDEDYDSKIEKRQCVSKQCAVTLGMYTVNGNTLDKEWSIWGRGLLRHGVFYVDIEGNAGI